MTKKNEFSFRIFFLQKKLSEYSSLSNHGSVTSEILGPWHTPYFTVKPTKLMVIFRKPLIFFLILVKAKKVFLFLLKVSLNCQFISLLNKPKTCTYPKREKKKRLND